MTATAREARSSETGASPRRAAAAGRTNALRDRPRLLLCVPGLAVVFWVAGFAAADPRSMTGLGLLSLFSTGTVVALVLLSTGMLLAIHRDAPESVAAAHLVTFLVLVHGTPAVLYGTLRYPWAYKHVGIVDYILRTGTVDPTIPVGTIYHNWPGFFAGGALLTSAAGQPDALQIASWAPLFFDLANLLVLRYVLRGLTRNRRLIWLALWFFFIINWVGQDYFSPQALAYVLYLACIGLLIRRPVRRGTVAAFIVLVAVVAASHQITPLMLMIAVTALVVLRRTRGWYLPALTLALTALWALTVARSYTVPNLYELLVSFGQPLENASETLEKTETVRSAAQQLVLAGGRSVVVVSTGVALLGAWRSWRVRGLRVTATLLMTVPGILILITGFGGEVLFRSFLFAAPFVAFLAAAACLPADGIGSSWRNLTAALALTTVLLPGFLLGYYGKEQQNYFTPGEVQAAAWVDEHAAPGSLLVEGSRNYPNQFKNYERFTYVPIDREDRESWQELLDDPAGRLQDWLSNERYTDAYVLITRSQELQVDTFGPMPAGSLGEVEEALRRSPRFRVAFETDDATVFVLAPSEEADR